MKQVPKTVWGNFSVGLIGRFVSQSVSFFVVVYLARILGPANYGDLSLALAVISYFNLLATFGLQTVGTREVARDQKNPQNAASKILSLRVCLATVAYLLLSIYGYYFVADSRLFYLLLLYGLTMLSSAWFLDWFFIGMEDIQSISIANALSSLCSSALIFLLVKDVNDIYYIPLIVFSGSVIASIYLLRLYKKIQPLRLVFDFLQFRNLLRVSMPFAVTGLLAEIYGNIDMLMIGYFAGAAEVGFYSVAYKIVFVLASIIGIYSQSTWPVMIRLFETDNQQLGDFLKQNLHSMIYFLLPIVVGGTILAHTMIIVFFGEAYEPAVLPFTLLLYYVFLMAISITMANFLLAIKQDKIYFKTLVLGAIINITVNFVLIPQWGSLGAAAVMVITELVILFFLLSQLKSIHKEPWIDNKFILASAGSSIIMAGGILGLEALLHLHVTLLILLGAIIYFALSWPFCAEFIRRAHTE
jgi:O-antigen/teichoic acid export membrane protein